MGRRNKEAEMGMTWYDIKGSMERVKQARRPWLYPQPHRKRMVQCKLSINTIGYFFQTKFLPYQIIKTKKATQEELVILIKSDKTMLKGHLNLLSFLSEAARSAP